MAPSFASLRSRHRDKSAQQQPGPDARYGDAAISPPNEGATWAEWTSPTPSPKLGKPSSPTSHSTEQDSLRSSSHKTSITITIQLPWQMRSKSRSSSLPPNTTSRKRESVSTQTQTSPPSRSRVASPQLGHTSMATREDRSSHELSRWATSSVNSATPALGVLSPLTESFDDPRTPVSTSSGFATSIESSPSSSFGEPTFKERSLTCRSRNSPSPEVAARSGQAVHRSQSLSRTSHARMNPRSLSPQAVMAQHRVATRQYTPPEQPPRRTRSVEPSSQHHRSSHEHYSQSPRMDKQQRGSHVTRQDIHRPHQQHQYHHQQSHPSCSQRTTRRPRGPFDDVMSDYKQIMRAVEADHDAARQTKRQIQARFAGHGNPNGQNSVGGSAGSGISADEGYSSGPQELVLGGDDLWG